jgi:hypothetical protein
MPSPRMALACSCGSYLTRWIGTHCSSQAPKSADPAVGLSRRPHRLAARRWPEPDSGSGHILYDTPGPMHTNPISSVLLPEVPQPRHLRCTDSVALHMFLRSGHPRATNDANVRFSFTHHICPACWQRVISIAEDITRDECRWRHVQHTLLTLADSLHLLPGLGLCEVFAALRADPLCSGRMHCCCGLGACCTTSSPPSLPV